MRGRSINNPPNYRPMNNQPEVPQAGPSGLTVDPRLIFRPTPRYPSSSLSFRSSRSSPSSVGYENASSEEEEGEDTNESPTGRPSPSPTEQSLGSSGSSSSLGSIDESWLPPHPNLKEPTPPVPIVPPEVRGPAVKLNAAPRILPLVPYVYNNLVRFNFEDIERIETTMKKDRFLESVKKLVNAGDATTKPWFDGVAIPFVRKNAAKPVGEVSIPAGLAISECLHGVHMEDPDTPIFKIGLGQDYHQTAISFVIRWPGYDKTLETDILVREASGAYITRRGLAYHIARCYLKYTKDIDFSSPPSGDTIWKLSDIINTDGITWHQIWIHGLVNTVGNVWQAIISIRNAEEALRDLNRNRAQDPQARKR